MSPAAFRGHAVCACVFRKPILWAVCVECAHTNEEKLLDATRCAVCSASGHF